MEVEVSIELEDLGESKPSENSPAKMRVRCESVSASGSTSGLSLDSGDGGDGDGSGRRGGRGNQWNKKALIHNTRGET